MAGGGITGSTRTFLAGFWHPAWVSSPNISTGLFFFYILAFYTILSIEAFKLFYGRKDYKVFRLFFYCILIKKP